MMHGTTGCAIFALSRLERMADIRAVVCITGNADCGNANGYQIEPNRWALGGLVDAAPTRGSARQKLVHLIASPVSEDKIAAVALAQRPLEVLERFAQRIVDRLGVDGLGVLCGQRWRLNNRRRRRHSNTRVEWCLITSHLVLVFAATRRLLFRASEQR
jgi:hypothetical protein